jgi:hypothetical protein
VGRLAGLKDKATLYFYLQTYHQREFPVLGSYRKFVEATNRYSVELRALPALLHRNRQAQCAYRIVLQDSTVIAVCHVACARQHCIFRNWARKSKTGMGWYGSKVHGQYYEAGRLCAFDLTTPTADDRKLLHPLTHWLKYSIVVGDGGQLSQAKAKELAARGVYLLTPTRKHMRHLDSPFQLACAIAWKSFLNS